MNFVRNYVDNVNRRKRKEKAKDLAAAAAVGALAGAIATLFVAPKQMRLTNQLLMQKTRSQRPFQKLQKKVKKKYMRSKEI